MIKRILVILLALFVVFAMFGCKDSGTDQQQVIPPPPPPPGDVVIDLGAFNLVLADNFQYGEGYQGVIQKDEIVTKMGKFLTGDKFTLEIEFTVSRDLEQELEIGLVDSSQNTWKGNNTYWGEISYDEDLGKEMYSIPAVNAGATVSKKIDLEAYHPALKADKVSNTIVFGTKGTGNPGTANSGVKGPVTVSFTKFVFTKTGEGEELPPPPPEPLVLKLEENKDDGGNLLGYQGYLEGSEWLPEGVAKVNSGDVYEISFTFTSDKTSANLNFAVVDNSSAGGWWTELTTSVGAGNFSTGVPFSKTITITADKGNSASSSDDNANRLFISTGTSPGDEVTLTFSVFTVTKK
jgi:hypothetical protein